MEFTITTPALLFPAISLLMLAFTNRFIALASLIRGLHRRYAEQQDPIIAAQIASLRGRIRLIKGMQLLGAVSFFLCILCMFVLFVGQVIVAQLIFGTALVTLMASLVFSALEVKKSSDALNLQLSDMESHKDATGKDAVT